MIIQCEKCATRFKVADDKVTPQGIKVRCSKCQHVFTARAGGPTTVSSGSVSRPSGIFAAPETQSPSASRSSSGPSSSGPPSSGSVSVPQASLKQDASFDPFAPPPASAGPRSSPSFEPVGGNGAGGSFGLDDGPAPGRDHSFFGAPNQTIGGGDDDVPEPPPAPPPSSGFGSSDRGPPTPTPTPTVDPFGASLHGGPSPDPFDSQPPSPADQTAAFVDPFAAPSGPSAPSAFPVGGDPFGAPASADPFVGGAGAQGDFGPPGADPFASVPPSPSSGAAGAPPDGGSSSGDDPFAGLGVEVDDPYAVDVDEPPPPPPPETPTTTPPPAAPAPVVAKVEAAPPQAPVRKRGLRIPPAVPRAAWAVVQACILAGFLTVSLVWVRGGSLDDIAEGQALEVVLGRASSQGEGQGPLYVEDVVVARRPVAVEPNLIVVSGTVVNGDAAQPAARVSVSFDGKHVESAWANAAVDGVDVAEAPTVEALLALNDRVPKTPALAPGARAPFVVLLRGAADADGRRARISVEPAEPPAPEVVEVAPAASDDDAKGKKGRRRPRRGQGKGDGKLEGRAGGHAAGESATGEAPRPRRARGPG